MREDMDFDSSLVAFAIIITGGIIVAGLFIVSYLNPPHELATKYVGFTMLLAITIGMGYYVGTKKAESGYFFLPEDLEELHRKVVIAETAKSEVELKEGLQRIEEERKAYKKHSGITGFILRHKVFFAVLVFIIALVIFITVKIMTMNVGGNTPVGGMGGRGREPIKRAMLCFIPKLKRRM